jgi:hypothetical protein
MEATGIKNPLGSLSQWVALGHVPSEWIRKNGDQILSFWNFPDHGLGYGLAGHLKSRGFAVKPHLSLWITPDVNVKLAELLRW